MEIMKSTSISLHIIDLTKETLREVELLWITYFQILVYERNLIHGSAIKKGAMINSLVTTISYKI